jgi:hypothetical protein
LNSKSIDERTRKAVVGCVVEGLSLLFVTYFGANFEPHMWKMESLSPKIADERNLLRHFHLKWAESREKGEKTINRQEKSKNHNPRTVITIKNRTHFGILSFFFAHS